MLTPQRTLLLLKPEKKNRQLKMHGIPCWGTVLYFICLTRIDKFKMDLNQDFDALKAQYESSDTPIAEEGSVVESDGAEQAANGVRCPVQGCRPPFPLLPCGV